MTQDEARGGAGDPPDFPPADAMVQGGPPAGTPSRKLKKRRVRRTPAAADPPAPAAPERVMEPLVVKREGAPPVPAPPTAVDGKANGHADGQQLVEVDVEREVIGTNLYRERRIVESVVELEVRPPTMEERRRAGGRERVRAAMRKRTVAEGGLRATLGYKTFYDLVCNRLGLVFAAFGSAMLLFVMLYDPMRRQPLEFGPMHLLGLAVAGVVYISGMVLEMLRAWSWECDASDVPEAVPSGAGRPATSARTATPSSPIPLVPEEALASLRKAQDSQPATGSRGVSRDRRR